MFQGGREGDEGLRREERERGEPSNPSPAIPAFQDTSQSQFYIKSGIWALFVSMR